MSNPVDLDIVIPVLNDARSLSVLLDDLRRINRDARVNLKVIVVDGSNCDETRSLTEAWGGRWLATRPGRGGQLQAGLLAGRGQTVWFLHADSRVDADVWRALQPLIGERVWGRFDVRLGDEPVAPGLRLIARMMNLRSRLTCIATGDQGIFAARALLEEAGGVPEQPLMEDIELSRALRHLAPPVCLAACLQTSPRRWHAGGLVRVVFRMFCLRLAYAFGASAETLARRYD